MISGALRELDIKISERNICMSSFSGKIPIMNINKEFNCLSVRHSSLSRSLLEVRSVVTLYSDQDHTSFPDCNQYEVMFAMAMLYRESPSREPVQQSTEHTVHTDKDETLARTSCDQSDHDMLQ